MKTKNETLYSCHKCDALFDAPNTIVDIFHYAFGVERVVHDECPECGSRRIEETKDV